MSGGIAAYKTPELVRLMVKRGAEVKVVLSPAACDFVTAKTLAVVSKNEVLRDFFDANQNWNNHVHLAEWADLLLIAPATANTIAKISSGFCDNVLMAVFMSARCPVVIAPAMDLEMYRNTALQHNLATLRERSVQIIPPGRGELASGLHGEGRMAEPAEIVNFIEKHFGKILPLTGKKVLVNAGPTYEAIDPVRFIGNRSSGKMGIALAEAFAEAGAAVQLVLGPTPLRVQNPAIRVIDVETAAQMRENTVEAFKECDMAVCAAAVADYTPEKKLDQKLKKGGDTLQLNLVKTTDILAELGSKKKPQQLLVGFALETNDLEKYAREKLASKNLDMVVANLAGQGESGIGSEYNAVTIITRDNKIAKFELQTKKALAANIVNFLIPYIHA